MHGLAPHEIDSLLAARAAGQRPSEMLRGLLARNASLGPADLAVGLSEAFGASLAAVGAVNGWWPDTPGALDDAALDALLDPVLGRPGPEAGWPVGTTFGDGRFTVTARVAGDPQRGLYRARDAEGGHARAVVTSPQRRPLDVTLGALRGPEVPPVLWSGRLAAPGAFVQSVVVERCAAEDARTRWRGPVDAAHVRAAVARLADLAGALHARGGTLQGVRPETVDLEGDAVVGASPRAMRLFLGAEPVPNVPAAFSLLYDAPEVVAGRAPTPAADVFTLAVLAAEWLSGRHPFAGDPPTEHFARLQSGRPSAPVPPALAPALDPDPRRRPALAALVSAIATAPETRS